MRYTILIERKERNYNAYCPDVTGCEVTGDTKAEAIVEVKKALSERLDKLVRMRQPLPVPHDVANDYAKIGLSPKLSIAHVEIDTLQRLSSGGCCIRRRNT